MKKRTLCVLLVSVFLMLIGASLFLYTFFTHKAPIEPTVYTIRTDFQQIEIDLQNTNLTICSDEKNYIEIIGYRDSDCYVSEENGKLLLTDRSDKSPLLFQLSGIGRYFKERQQQSEPKRIVLHLSSSYLQTPVNLILKDSTLTLSASPAYLTLHAENSTLSADGMTFERFNGKLINCNSVFSLAYKANGFSRNIETHNTVLSLNGDERANTEQYATDFQKPSLVIEAHGGSCRLNYPQENP